LRAAGVVVFVFLLITLWKNLWITIPTETQKFAFRYLLNFDFHTSVSSIIKLTEVRKPNGIYIKSNYN